MGLLEAYLDDCRLKEQKNKGDPHKTPKSHCPVQVIRVGKKESTRLILADSCFGEQTVTGGWRPSQEWPQPSPLAEGLPCPREPPATFPCPLPDHWGLVYVVLDEVAQLLLGRWRQIKTLEVFLVRCQRMGWSGRLVGEKVHPAMLLF